MKNGDKGSGVANLQMLLGVKPDGIFGSQTAEAYEIADKDKLEERNKFYRGVPYDRKTFFDLIRPIFFKGLNQSQVDAINNIIDSFDERSLPITWQAYMWATLFHETAATMRPLEEYGKGKGRDYGKKLKMSRKAYDKPNFIYYGRGFVQLTWYENYENVGKTLGVDLLNNPSLALDMKVAFKVMEYGMESGYFTSRKLGDYNDDWRSNYVESRKIINGRDKQHEIAAYADKFEYAIRLAKLVTADVL